MAVDLNILWSDLPITRVPQRLHPWQSPVATPSATGKGADKTRRIPVEDFLYFCDSSYDVSRSSENRTRVRKYWEIQEKATKAISRARELVEWDLSEVVTHFEFLDTKRQMKLLHCPVNILRRFASCWPTAELFSSQWGKLVLNFSHQACRPVLFMMCDKSVCLLTFDVKLDWCIRYSDALASSPFFYC